MNHEEKEEVKKKRANKASRHKHVVSNCGHNEATYYANGMCKNCYHYKGRTKKPTNCDHTERTLYAKGVCKNCYLSIYHKQKRRERKIMKQAKNLNAPN